MSYNNKFQDQRMNCKSKLFYSIIAILILGYQAFAIVLFFFIYCQKSWQYYDDEPINLSLGNWMIINILVSFMYFVISIWILVDGCINKRESQIFEYLFHGGLYSLFEVIWCIIGFILFYNHYCQDCASSGSFNTIVIITLYYGISLFPLLTILIVLLMIKIIN